MTMVKSPSGASETCSECGTMTAKDIADTGTILRATVGSNLHGLALEGTDDRDEMGVCVEPAEYVVGMRQFEQYIHRTQPEGVRSGPGDLDLTVYGLRKYVRLALNGNPTILLLLFAPKEYCHIRDDLGVRLQAMAPYIVSRRAGSSYLGYMVAQKQRLLGERGQKRTKRPELEEAHGFDTKYAAHIIRLGYQGIELLSTGSLTLPMPDPARTWVRELREGKVSMQECLTQAGRLESELRDLLKTSPLPHEPDRATVDDFLIETYREAWLWM